jgi:antitoxin (DNA-binding transcriptional repressor) of toxin-antitoxin stability system
MSKMISIGDANEVFARCIRDVQAGAEYVVTDDGEAVARIVPVRPNRPLTSTQEAAFARLCERMEQGWHLGAEPLDRDALHERR